MLPHLLLKVAIRDMFEGIAFGLWHFAGRSLNEPQGAFRRKESLHIRFDDFLVRFEWIAVVGFLSEMRENLSIDFPFHM